MRHRLLVLGLVLLLPALAGCGRKAGAPTAPAWDSAPADGPILLEDFSARPLFTRDSPWRLDVSRAPLDPNSAAYIAFIGDSTPFRHYFGPDPSQGIPYVGVPGTQPLVPVTFDTHPREADAEWPGRPGGYPIPEQVKTNPDWMQDGRLAYGDRHMILVDRDHWVLYELAGARWDSAGGSWHADIGAVFDLSAEPHRPDGWASADAAGLPILPGLVRYDETFTSTAPIEHAFRVSGR
jgi:hypothetical protein